MKITSEIKAGIFILVTLALLFMSVFIMGRERQIFAAQEKFQVTYKDIKGLSPGAPVRLGGITIGRVDRVAFGERLNDPKVHVTLLINEDFLNRIREDSVATIETQGLLGDRFVSISSGASAKILPPDSVLPSDEGADISQALAKAQKVVDQTVEIAANINATLKEFNTNAAPEISQAAKNIRSISDAIANGDGLMHRLVYSKKDGDEILKSINTILEDVEAISTQIKDGQGVLHALVYEPGGKELLASLTSASGNIGTLSSDLSTVIGQIKDGNGLLHDAIYGKSPEGVDDIVRQLSETAANLKEASQALAAGSGTLGALLVDSTLYDNLVEVTDGAKRSFLLREAIQSSLGQ